MHYINKKQLFNRVAFIIKYALFNNKTYRLLNYFTLSYQFNNLYIKSNIEVNLNVLNTEYPLIVNLKSSLLNE